MEDVRIRGPVPSGLIKTVSPMAMIERVGFAWKSWRVSLTWKVMPGATRVSLVSFRSKRSSLMLFPI